MSKYLFNSTSSAVSEALDGLCASTPALARLDGFPDIKVVVDLSHDSDSQVAVIAGGGGGHEPTHAGYVGAGMLSAAAVGDIFACPPAEAVLAAIQSVTGPPGCLLVVANYTGDRLNFGLAAEQAKGLGLKVEMVAVGDDCALPGTGIAGRRGIAGNVLVLKIAGAAAASGQSLEEVKRRAEEAAAAVGSVGVATRTCSLPGQLESTRLGNDEIEVGLGAHGEPGASKRKISAVDDIVEEIVETIVSRMQLQEFQGHCALLVNNLRAASGLEMGVITSSAIRCLSSRGIKLGRIYAGTFMTSLNMAGFSLSLLKLTSDRERLLDRATEAPAWPGKSAKVVSAKRPLPVPSNRASASFRRPQHLSESGKVAERAISEASAALKQAAAQLDEWDRRVGDGDCGTTVARGASATQNALKSNMPLNDAAELARYLADCSRVMGGTSGALYNIFFTAAATKLPQEGSASAKQMAEAFTAGADSIVQYGGAAEGSRTMLDALLPAARAFKQAASEGQGIDQAASAAANAAQKGADATKEMTAEAGRSSYVPEAQTKGVPDPGAMAVLVWLKAAADSMQ